MLSAGQHTLIKQPDGDDLYKNCILVKLTDSSAKAIEEFLRNKNNVNKKPSIVFHNDKAGEITFPIESSNANHKKFYFSLSGVKESNKDISAAFECIHYANNKLKTIGTVEQKLTVQANDEVFQATKEKATKEAEEEKKNSTIEIKPSGAIVNRNSLGSNAVNRNKIQPPKPPVTTNQEIVKPRNPMLDRPLKERLIHLLALKPFNKAELSLKLGKDLNDKDKEQFENLLQTVAVFNQKNNTFEIASDVLLNEVKEDWPFYSLNEKHFVKKNINKAKERLASQSLNQSLPASLPHKNTLTGSNKTSAFSIPASSNKSLNLSNQFETSFDELNSKHINKKVSPQKSEQFKPILSSSHNVKQSKPTSVLSKQASDLFSSSSASSDEASADDLSFNFNNKRVAKEDAFNGRKNKVDFEFKERAQEIENMELKECQKKYRKITSPQQKQQYIQDYDQLYKEYVELHHYIDGLKEKFDKLKSDLSSLNETSREFIEKRQKVVDDYILMKKDPEYKRKRDQYNRVYTKIKYLHELLSQSSDEY
ncbi:unnamed protein product [Brachionus calyciflorus]|uniref:OCEL domain-containing protein n=1 Tax=Brachionus calyciflorus TaxID=104777 RepID=A0A813SJ83_9BILA|nr:unnamed protein product [Brachionus calyciflorus]